jgi:hypothetical protein
MAPTLTKLQRAILFLLFAAVSFEPAVDVQLNLLASGFLVIAVTAATQDRWWCSALAAMLACALKVYPVALALVLLGLYPRRYGVRFLALVALGLAAPFLLQSPGYVFQQYQDWIRWGLNDRHVDHVDGVFRDVMLFARVWLSPISRSTYQVLQLVVGAAIAIVCWRQSRIDPSKSRLMATVLVLCSGWMMAFGPATEGTTYIIFAPAATWAVLQVWITPTWTGRRMAVTAAFLILVAAQVQLLLPFGRPVDWLAGQPVATLIFMVSAASSALQKPPMLIQCAREINNSPLDGSEGRLTTAA